MVSRFSQHVREEAGSASGHQGRDLPGCPPVSLWLQGTEGTSGPQGREGLCCRVRGRCDVHTCIHLHSMFR